MTLATTLGWFSVAVAARPCLAVHHIVANAVVVELAIGSIHAILAVQQMPNFGVTLDDLRDAKVVGQLSSPFGTSSQRLLNTLSDPQLAANECSYVCILQPVLC